VAVLVAAGLAVGCGVGATPATPPISPGSSAAPREVNIIAKDWQFVPDRIDIVPGETVLFHVVNGGLEVHEVVIGDAAVQDAWEVAEAAVAEHPPGPTPFVSVPPAVAGVRVVVQSGQRVDLVWTAPAGPAGSSAASGLVVGCHIPGHWAKGMFVPIEFVLAPGGSPPSSVIGLAPAVETHSAPSRREFE
jgi:uncharacterized cupredoxin-like copper-binding protein